MGRKVQSDLSGKRLSFRLDEASSLTGLPVKRLRTEAALGNLKLTKIGPRTTHVLQADLEAFLNRARGKVGA